MSKTLSNVNLLELIPINLRDDPDIIAASAATDKEFQLMVQKITRCYTIANVDNVEEIILDHLAAEMNVDFYSTKFSVDIKRNLVKNGYLYKYNKGTSAILEESLSTIFSRAKLEEWWEYGGEPYMFRIQILEVDNEGITEEMLWRLNNLIKVLKNARSWLDGINIYLTGRGKMHIASSTVSGEKVTVYPWNVTKIETTGKCALGTASQIVETLTVYPQ